MSADDPRWVSPRRILEQVAATLPQDCRRGLVVGGSLAAGYHLFGDDDRMQIRTKDVDCILSPRVQMVPTGQAIVRRLLAERWTPRATEGIEYPGRPGTDVTRLPAVRFTPPGDGDWFLELLTIPESTEAEGKQWSRLETPGCDYAVPSFRFLCLVDLDPVVTEFGIAVARLEMLALANLLEHPEIRPERMLTPIGGRRIKRSNKDLGRVLAIARQAGDDLVEAWPARWADALRRRFGKAWVPLARRAGNGLRLVLDERHELDLGEALHTCRLGLLAANPPAIDQLRASGRRLIKDAIEPLEAAARA